MLIDGTYYHNGFVVSYEYVMQWEKEQGNLINIYNRNDEIPNVGIYANWDNFSKGNSEGQFIAGDPTKFVVPPRPKFLQAPKSEQSCYQDPFATLINNIADGNFDLVFSSVISFISEGGPGGMVSYGAAGILGQVEVMGMGAKNGIKFISFQSTHVTSHIAELGISSEVIEKAIFNNVRLDIQNASNVGPFWGRISIGEQLIEYRGYNLGNGIINIGTYYKVIP